MIETALHAEEAAARIEVFGRLAVKAGNDLRVKVVLLHVAGTDSDPYVQQAATEVLAELE